MAQVTATEFKNRLGKYLDMAKSEDIIITKNSTVIAMLTSPHQGASIVDGLTGVIPDNTMSQSQIREGRRERYENSH